MNEKQPIGLVAEASEAAAVGVDPPGHGDSDQHDESNEEAGNKKSAGPAQDSREKQGAAEDFDPGKNEGREEGYLVRNDAEILDVLSERHRVTDFEEARRKERPADDQTEDEEKIFMANHFLRQSGVRSATIRPSHP